MVRITLFGGTVIHTSGSATSISRPRVRHLVAVLAAHNGHYLSRSALIDDLWPSGDIANPLPALNVLISRARGLVEAKHGPFIETSADRFRIALPRTAVDLVAWTELIEAADSAATTSDHPLALALLEQAVDLHTGEPFIDVDSSAILSAQQLQHERNLIRSLRLTADTLGKLGRWPEASQQALTLYERWPDREDLAILAMSSCARANRSGESLRVAARLRKTLRDEFGTAPSPAFADLELSLLNDSASPRDRKGTASSLSGVGDDIKVVTDGAEPVDVHRHRQVLASSDLGEVMSAAKDCDQSARREEADDLFERAVELAIQQSQMDILAEAALGGTGHASMIGGNDRRRARLNRVRRLLTEGSPAHNRVVVESALEELSAYQPYGADVHTELVRIASGSDPAAILAARCLLIVDEIQGRSTFEQATTLMKRLDFESTDDVTARSAAMVVCANVAMSLGHWVQADHWLGDLLHLGRTSGEPRAQWQSLACKAVVAEAKGDRVTGDRFAAEALSVGRELGLADAENTFMLHGLGKAFGNGSLAPLAPVFDVAVDRYRGSIWLAFRALAWTDAGREGQANKLLDAAVSQLRSDRVALIDYFHAPGLVVAARCAVQLGRRDVAVELEPWIAQRAGRFAFVGYGGPCLGVFDQYRADLYELMGDDTAAARCRAAAHATCTSARAFGCLDRLIRPAG
jgi:DNA-binding SARP family transcriptional activator